jgi:sarcosine oxidase, subunit beta
VTRQTRQTGTSVQHEADVVVVGGGIHGAAVAYELTAAGAEVILLERNQIASGASGGPGMRGVRANGRDPRELPLMRRAYDLWPNLTERLGVDSGYHRTGGLELVEAATVADELAWAQVKAQVSLQLAHGIPTELLDRDEIVRLQPGIDTQRVAAAVHCPLDGVADQTAATRAYAMAAARNGADVREGVTVTAVHADADGRGTLLETAGGHRLRARTATVLAMNTYVRQLLADAFDLRLPTWRMTPQVSMVRPPAEVALTHLIGHVTRPLAAKTLTDGTIMLSGGRRGRWDEQADHGEPNPDVPGQNLADMASAFPALDRAPIVATDASRSDSSCVDGIPIIDRVPQAPGVFFATGWTGHGFAIAPAVARLLAEWVLTGRPETELVPFGLARLGLAPVAA